MHIAGFDSCPSICNIRFTSSSSLHTWWFYAPSDTTYIGPVSCVLWRHILEQSHVDCGTTHRTTLMWIVAPHIGPLSCELWHHTSDQSHVCCGATYRTSLMWIVAPHIGPLSCGLWHHIDPTSTITMCFDTASLWTGKKRFQSSRKISSIVICGIDCNVIRW